jgi:hypothetical protein
MVSVPTPLLPGASTPLELIVTGAPMKPKPPRVAVLLTTTAPEPIPLPPALFTSTVPPRMLMPPLNVLTPVSVQVPLPSLTKVVVPSFLSVPAKVALAWFQPTW